MKLEKFQEEIERTCPHLSNEFTDQLHMALGASTEAGELLDVYKKFLAYGKEMDVTNIIEEIGDSFWYLVNLCRMLDINPEEVMERCVSKLRVRYPEKFTEERANNRDLEAERKALEEGKVS